MFENYFDLPVLVICARIVDITDKKVDVIFEYLHGRNLLLLFYSISIHLIDVFRIMSLLFVKVKPIPRVFFRHSTLLYLRIW